MINSKNLEKLLRKLLKKEFKRVSYFAKYFIENNPSARSSLILGSYHFLKRKGALNKDIAKNASLLRMGRIFLEANYRLLRKKGLEKEDVITNINLLGRDPEKLNYNFNNLRKKGFSKVKIASRSGLIERNRETINRRFKKYPGLMEKLSDIEDGKKVILKQPQLLEISEDTLEANIMYLSHFKIKTLNGILLGTTPQNKRKKIAYLLRELFDYRNLNEEKKKEAIKQAYAFVRESPTLLAESYKVLDKRMSKLRREVKVIADLEYTVDLEILN